jgi:hypothetical protein
MYAWKECMYFDVVAQSRIYEIVHHTCGDQFEMPKDGNRRKQTHHAQNCCFIITLARKRE